jgi:hypothetical protein
MKKYKRIAEESLYYWLGVSLDNSTSNIKKMDLIACLNRNDMDKIESAFNSASNITVFSVDVYGKSSENSVRNYFKNYNIMEILYYKGKSTDIKKLIKNVYEDIK